ncbi:hypothetical protein GCM10022278_34820 [Allohahella marinimesophila]|uniref:Uncharacterized protein n=1 Tax=Allohahella marinimesophila TaxID=1054972 RepID=A0ABP7Q183_9GAMM
MIFDHRWQTQWVHFNGNAALFGQIRKREARQKKYKRKPSRHLAQKGTRALRAENGLRSSTTKGSTCISTFAMLQQHKTYHRNGDDNVRDYNKDFN